MRRSGRQVGQAFLPARGLILLGYLALSAAGCAPRAAPEPARLPAAFAAAVIPLDDVEDAFLARSADLAAAVTGGEVALLPRRAPPDSARDAPRRALRTEDALDGLAEDRARLAPAGGAPALKRFFLLGVTAGALVAPRGFEPYGAADARRGAALAALGPLTERPGRWGRDEPSRVRERFSKVVLHEVAHALGLGHCAKGASGCVMTKAKSLPELDAQGARFCPECLARLAAATGQRPEDIARRIEGVLAEAAGPKR